MKLKGVVALDKKIGRVPSYYGLRTRLDTEFTAYLSDNVIGYTVFLSEVEDECFNEYIRELYPDAPKLTILTWSVLHEVGHFQTDREVAKFGYDRSARLELLSEPTDTPIIKREKMRKYLRLRSESLPTQWAVEFVRNNRELVEQWNADILKSLNQFYKINGITE